MLGPILNVLKGVKWDRVIVAGAVAAVIIIQSVQIERLKKVVVASQDEITRLTLYSEMNHKARQMEIASAVNAIEDVKRRERDLRNQITVFKGILTLREKAAREAKTIEESPSIPMFPDTGGVR